MRLPPVNINACAARSHFSGDPVARGYLLISCPLVSGGRRDAAGVSDGSGKAVAEVLAGAENRPSSQWSDVWLHVSPGPNRGSAGGPVAHFDRDGLRGLPPASRSILNVWGCLIPLLSDTSGGGIYRLYPFRTEIGTGVGKKKGRPDPERPLSCILSADQAALRFLRPMAPRPATPAISIHAAAGSGVGIRSALISPFPDDLTLHDGAATRAAKSETGAETSV